MTKDAFYFSHDANARHDPKILEMRATYGAQGYGWYWMIIEILRDQEDYRIKIKDGVWGALSLDLNADKDEIKKFVSDCVNQFELLSNDGGYIWSNSLIRRMAKREEIAKLRSEAGKIGGSVKRQKAVITENIDTEHEWQEMIKFFDSRCVKCGSEVGNNMFVKDLIIPINQGGIDDISNLQPLCQTCSQSKDDNNTDYRVIFCQANDMQMPSNWQSNQSKERKGKEIKIKEIKGEESKSNTYAQTSKPKSEPNMQDSPILFNFSTKDWVGITDNHRKIWNEAYPECDIDSELARMKAWILSAGSKGHKKNWQKFITGWLSRAREQKGVKIQECKKHFANERDYTGEELQDITRRFYDEQ